MSLLTKTGCIFLLNASCYLSQIKIMQFFSFLKDRSQNNRTQSKSNDKKGTKCRDFVKKWFSIVCFLLFRPNTLPFMTMHMFLNNVIHDSWYTLLMVKWQKTKQTRQNKGTKRSDFAKKKVFYCMFPVIWD